MKVYEIIHDGDSCVFHDLESAKTFLEIDIEESNITDDDFYKSQEEIKNLEEEQLPYKVGEFTLKLSEMSEEQFENLEEFNGW